MRHAVAAVLLLLAYVAFSVCLALAVSGCADHDNPRGPKQHPKFHYPNCMNRCTVIGFNGPQQHLRRP